MLVSLVSTVAATKERAVPSLTLRRDVSFQHELGPDVQSFAQLLHRKDEIIELLKKHLAVEESLALQPLLA